MVTAAQLRQLLAQYRARLSEGENLSMVEFILEAIHTTESELARLEENAAWADEPGSVGRESLQSD